MPALGNALGLPFESGGAGSYGGIAPDAALEEDLTAVLEEDGEEALQEG